MLVSASQKLGISYDSRLKLVLAEDGTEVDEDMALEEYHLKLFLLLRPNEEWKQDGVTVVVNGIYNIECLLTHDLHVLPAVDFVHLSRLCQ